MNHEMNFGPYAVPATRMVSIQLIQQVKDLQGAIQLCIQESNVWRSDKTWAEICGTTTGNFSLLVRGNQENRKRHIPDDFIDTIETNAGNLAVTQWRAWKKGCVLQKLTSEQRRILELEAENEALRLGLGK